MAKLEVKQRQMAKNDGHEVENSLILNESILPSPSDLEYYKNVDPRIIDLFITTTLEEQKYRHTTEQQRIKLVRSSERRLFSINWWGMFFAFLIVVAALGLAAYALSLDRPWFAGFGLMTALIAITSIFVKGGDKKQA